MQGVQEGDSNRQRERERYLEVVVTKKMHTLSERQSE